MGWCAYFLPRKECNCKQVTMSLKFERVCFPNWPGPPCIIFLFPVLVVTDCPHMYPQFCSDDFKLRKSFLFLVEHAHDKMASFSEQKSHCANRYPFLYIFATSIYVTRNSNIFPPQENTWDSLDATVTSVNFSGDENGCLPWSTATCTEPGHGFLDKCLTSSCTLERSIKLDQPIFIVYYVALLRSKSMEMYTKTSQSLCSTATKWRVLVHITSFSPKNETYTERIVTCFCHFKAAYTLSYPCTSQCLYFWPLLHT